MTVESGEKAVSAFRDHRPDIVVMNDDMGDGMSGWEAAVLIYEEQKGHTTATTPVLLTVDGPDNVFAVMPKPLKVLELVRAVKKLADREVPRLQ